MTQVTDGITLRHHGERLQLYSRSSSGNPCRVGNETAPNRLFGLSALEMDNGRRIYRLTPLKKFLYEYSRSREFGGSGSRLRYLRQHAFLRTRLIRTEPSRCPANERTTQAVGTALDINAWQNQKSNDPKYGLNVRTPLRSICMGEQS